MDHSGMDMGEGSSTSMSGSTMTMKMYVHGTIGGDVLWFRSWQPSSAGATVGLCIGLFLLAILDRYLHALWRACTAAWARGQVGFVLPRAGGAEPSNVNMVVRAEDEDDGGSARAVPIIAQPTAVSSAVSLVSELEKSCCARKDKDASTTTDSSNSLAKEKTDEFAPAPCQCGCGGECGAGSAPVYSEVEPEPATRARSIKSIVTPAYAYLPAAAQRNLDPRRERRWSRPFRWGADVPRGFLWAVQTIVHFLVMLTVMTFNLWWIISVVVGAGVGEALFGRFGSR